MAGEPSGDMHGSHVIRELRSVAPDLETRGFGGPLMQAEGFHLLEDLASDAIMGLFPVIKALPRIRGWFAKALQDMETNRPDALVLIDYPGFNLRLAARAKKMGIPVIYYISPQVWAWNQKRVEKIRAVVDLMIVILPFEETFYRKHNVHVYYAGHPLADRLATNETDPQTVATLRQLTGSPMIGLFPGSRPHVVKALTPEFLNAAHELRNNHGLSQARFIIAAANQSLADWIQSRPEMDGLPVTVVTQAAFEVMEVSDVALTTSGTTTLELAGHLTPMVLAYKVSPILLAIGRLVVKVPFIGLVNLIAEKACAPEHIGTRNMAKNLAADLSILASDSRAHEKAVGELKRVVQKLDAPGSYQRTAAKILSFLSAQSQPPKVTE